MDPHVPLRVILSGAGDPWFNMAADEALLCSDCGPTLRLYRWHPPALSLGYFQPAALAPADAHPVVRRLTGGGAIFHDDEITFALALPAPYAEAELAASYRAVHEAAARALRAVGVPAEPAPAGPAKPRGGEGWCFASPAAPDLVVTGTGRKILGSAQRRVRRPRPRVLHHGSLVLSPPAHGPACASVADHVDPRAVEERLLASLAAELAAALGLAPVAGELTADEAAAAAALLPRVRLRSSVGGPRAR
jgi:lipoate-protein ligase A